MGLFDALTSAVSGLQAQAFAMQNISGNISNSQTIAYKGVNTSFEDLIPGGGALSNQVAGGVIATSQATNGVQGAIQTSSVGTDMAINGDGYFIVQSPASYSGSSPIFAGVNSYTRRGDFQLNAQGYLVNSAGYYLEGIPIDPTTGNPTGSVGAPLQFANNFLRGQSVDRGHLRHQSADHAAHRRLQFLGRQFRAAQSRRLHRRPDGRRDRNRSRQRRQHIRQ